MLPFFTIIGILFVVACLFEWEWLATLIGIVLGVVLIYCLFVYFTEVMIGLICIVGLGAIVMAGPTVVKTVSTVVKKDQE